MKRRQAFKIVKKYFGARIPSRYGKQITLKQYAELSDSKYILEEQGKINAILKYGLMWMD